MKKIYIYTIIAVSVLASGAGLYGTETTVRLYFSTGASYNFDISAKSFSNSTPVFFDVPFRIALDVRFIRWFSLYSGIEAAYSFHLNEYEFKDLRLQNHNMYIRVPLIDRFYPMAFNEENYQNIYIGIGGFAHIWPLNYYTIYDSDSEETSVENGYFPVHEDMPPAHIYSPVNAGTTFSIGNSFPFAGRMLFGLEIFTNFMFIPYKNGYYASPAFDIDGWIPLNFYANLGIMIAIGIEFKKTNM